MLNQALTSDHIRDFVRKVGQYLTYWNLHRLTLEEKGIRRRLLSEKTRGDWTPLELFLAGVRLWEVEMRRRLARGNQMPASRDVARAGREDRGTLVNAQNRLPPESRARRGAEAGGGPAQCCARSRSCGDCESKALKSPLSMHPRSLLPENVPDSRSASRALMPSPGILAGSIRSNARGARRAACPKSCCTLASA